MTIHLLLALTLLAASPDTSTKPASHPPTKKIITTGKSAPRKLKHPIPVEQLKAITARGKLLVEYEAAAGPASDAVLALKPAEPEVTNYFLLKKADGWVAAFGRINDKQDKFLIAYEATKGKDDQQFTARKITPLQEDTGFYYGAARAVAAAAKDFVPAKAPYNTYVLPGPADQIYVYFMPAQTRRVVYPYGADARYLYSRDGGTLVAKRQMHVPLMEDRADSKEAKAGIGAHSHAEADVPEDSDVFHVLIRKPPREEYVSTSKGVFAIAVDGSIQQVR